MFSYPVSVDVLYCIITEEDHRSVVETFGWKNKFLLNLQASVKRVSVDVLYCITTEEDHRSVVETFG